MITNIFNAESLTPGIAHAPPPLSEQARDVREILEARFGEHSAPSVTPRMAIR